MLPRSSLVGGGAIKRSWLRRLADRDPAILLAASTIWGSGIYVCRGRAALHTMVSTSEFEAVTRELTLGRALGIVDLQGPASEPGSGHGSGGAEHSSRLPRVCGLGMDDHLYSPG